jgi:hypothetical protein
VYVRDKARESILVSYFSEPILAFVPMTQNGTNGVFV